VTEYGDYDLNDSLAKPMSLVNQFREKFQEDVSLVNQYHEKFQEEMRKVLDSNFINLIQVI